MVDACVQPFDRCLPHDRVDVQRADIYAVERDEPLDRVLAEMAERHIGSAVVTDGGKLVGVFTATDACRYFAEYLRSR